MSGASNNDLARRLTSDVSRLRRVYADSVYETPSAAQPSPLASQESPDHNGQDEPPETGSPEVAVLSEMERRALFVALSAGTERRLGRLPTVDEFVRLTDAVVMARQLPKLAQGLLADGVEICWTGQEWLVHPVGGAE